MRVVVVGGGIMGLAAAWAALKRGHGVVLLEQGPLPNPHGASVDRHRLIRYAYGGLPGYAALMADGYAAWDRLWHDLGVVRYVPTGTLILSGAGDAWGPAAAAGLDRIGHPYDRLPLSLAERRWPHLAFDGVETVLHMASGGVLLAERIVDDLARWLAANGAEVRPHTRVREVDPVRGRAVLASGEAVDGDGLVLAAGPWLPKLLPALAGRVVPSRQLVVYVEPPVEMRRHWQQGPMFIAKVPPDMVYTVPPVAGTALKIGDHGFSRTGDPDGDRAATAAEARAVLELGRGRLKAFERYRVLEARACFYDVTEDERFVLERHGAAVAMSGFSGHGFKFGALLGEAAIDGLEGRSAPEELARRAAGRIEP